MLEEHPELELTKFSAEVDWPASSWPIQNRTNVEGSLIAFQYKIKSNSLMTPLRVHEQSLNTAQTPDIENLPGPECIVCKHSTQMADLEHIFTYCTVAHEHNQKLLQDIQALQQTLETPLPVWFNTEQIQTTRA